MSKAVGIRHKVGCFLICAGAVSGAEATKAICRIVVAVAVVTVVSGSAVARVVTWPAAEGTVATDGEYRVSVDGRPVDVVFIPKPSMHDEQLTGDENLQPYYATFFDADEEVQVVVESPKDLSSVRILPSRLGISPSIDSKHRVSFRAKPPFKLSFEPRPRHRALVFSAHLPERDVPSPNAPGVRYFAAGRHHFDRPIELKSNETMYLAPGAWVEAAVWASGTNMVVCGRGVLSGQCWDWRKGPAGQMMLVTGSDVTVRDLTVVGSWHWSVALHGCDRALVEGVSILNGRVLNDDGIDVCNCRNALIRNVFVRSQDDCIAVKDAMEGVRVENAILWTDVANSLRIGYECRGVPLRFTDFQAKGVDIIHLSVQKPPRGVENAVCIQASNGMIFEKMLFEDFRFDGMEIGDNIAKIQTLRIEDQWQRHESAGYVRAVTFRDFSFPGGLFRQGPLVRLESYDDAHTVEGVSFEGFDSSIEFWTWGQVKYVRENKGHKH